jgi:hypothetical protein
MSAYHFSLPPYCISCHVISATCITTLPIASFISQRLGFSKRMPCIRQNLFSMTSVHTHPSVASVQRDEVKLIAVCIIMFKAFFVIDQKLDCRYEFSRDRQIWVYGACRRRWLMMTEWGKLAPINTYTDARVRETKCHCELLGAHQHGVVEVIQVHL